MNPYLFPSLPTGPKLLWRLIQSVREDKLDLPTHPCRFTPREIAAHLADWEPILRERMRRTLEEPGCEILGIDEGERAVEQRYSEKDALVESARYIEERALTIGWLRSLPAEAWSSVAIHNERGPMSLTDQANLLLGHDLYHIEQLFDAI